MVDGTVIRLPLSVYLSNMIMVRISVESFKTCNSHSTSLFGLKFEGWRYQLSKKISGSMAEGDIHAYNVLCQIPSTGCTSVDLQAGVLRLEVLLGKMSYMIHLRK